MKKLVLFLLILLAIPTVCFGAVSLFKISATGNDVSDTGSGTGGFSTTRTSIPMGDTLTSNCRAAYRFLNVRIIEDGTGFIKIDHAYLIGKSPRAYTGIAPTLLIRASNVDNAPAITTHALFVDSITAHLRTTAAVAWTPPNFAANTWYPSPDIGTIIQEIVDRPGWVAGNAINIFIEDNGSTDNYVRRFYDYSNSAANACSLRVYWHTGNDSTRLTVNGQGAKEQWWRGVAPPRSDTLLDDNCTKDSALTCPKANDSVAVGTSADLESTTVCNFTNLVLSGGKLLDSIALYVCTNQGTAHSAQTEAAVFWANNTAASV